MIRTRLSPAAPRGAARHLQDERHARHRHAKTREQDGNADLDQVAHIKRTMMSGPSRLGDSCGDQPRVSPVRELGPRGARMGQRLSKTKAFSHRYMVSE